MFPMPMAAMGMPMGMGIGMTPMGMAMANMASMSMMSSMAMGGMGMGGMGMGGMGMGGMAALGMGMAGMAMMCMANDTDGEVGPNGELTEGKRYHGIVKSFDPETQACIFMIPGAKEDVFALKMSVPEMLRGKPLGGQPFAFEVERAPDGRLHAKECDWKGKAESSLEASSGRDEAGPSRHGSRKQPQDRSCDRGRSRSRSRRDDGRSAPIGACDLGSSWWEMRESVGNADDGGRGHYGRGMRDSARGQSGRDTPGGVEPELGFGAAASSASGCMDGRMGGATSSAASGHSEGNIGGGMTGSIGRQDGKGAGKGRDDGVRFQGQITSWVDGHSGYIQCPQMHSDMLFLIEDLPQILQRHEEARHYLLSVGTKVLFTVYNLDEGPPRAREVMPVPAIGDFIIGRVKNYGANSGYGFIKPVEDSPFTHDLYFNHKDFSTRAGDCMRLKLEGVVCKFNVRLTPDGKGQAKNIEVVAWPDSQADEDSAKSAGLTLHGIIQTYKVNSGYGFINCPKLGRDVWFPRRELPSDLMGRDLLGTHVEFDLWVQGDEKPQARSVRVLKGNTTESLRLDLMSSRGRGSNMTVHDKVAIWRAHTGQLPCAAAGAAAAGAPGMA